MSEEISKEELESIAKQENKEAEVIDTEAMEIEEVKEVVVKAIREEFSGPIPHPDIMKKYEDILPGATDRIMAMAERQATHRQELEKKIVMSESRDGMLGVVFAFLLGIGCLVAGTIMVFCVPQSGGAIAGAIVGVTGIGTITSNFIRSAKSNSGTKKKETEDTKTQ